ncbi:MAG: hypothetical protein CMH30_02110 [Micavibrio sp.]|nr:hypothetical protein [Micavibrio sp.]|tara:strand:+ start:160 stop:354 length:195 start_codon:yes stop_codon:yes gene_type:complete
MMRAFIIAAGTTFAGVGISVINTAQETGSMIAGVALTCIFGLAPIAIGFFGKNTSKQQGLTLQP